MYCCRSVAQSCPTLRSHGLQHARLPCLSPISWSLLKLISIESVMPSNRLILCHPLLLLPSVFPSIRVFSVSQFFTSGGQSIGVLASTSVLPMNIQDWFPLELTGLISLQSKGLSRVFSNTTVQCSVLWSSSHICHYYWKTIALWAKWCLCFLIQCQDLS